ncbi:MAG TPA: hypothetical protein VGK67_19175 [Myxococcales bacterium]|jgi:hypothetical protein
MRRVLPVLLAAASLWAAPASAGLGISIGGDAGAGYSRTDVFLPWHRSGQGLDFVVAINASGGGLSPGLLVWRLGAEYQPRRDSWGGTVDTTHNLTFHLDLDALRELPVNVRLNASRTLTDSTSVGLNPRVGTVTTTAVGGAVALRLDRLPSVNVGVTHSVTETRAPGVADASATNTGLTVGVNENLKNYQYDLGYGTGWNQGSYAENNYQSHNFTLNARLTPSEEVMLYLRDTYFLRQPTTDASTNPRFDSNSLGTGVQWRPRPTTTNGLDYAYSHVLVQAQGTPEIESLSQSVGDTLTWRYSPALSFNGSASVAYGEERSDALSRKAAGETMGLGAFWQYGSGAHSLSLGGGGSVGFVEPLEAPVEVSWGVSLSTSYTWVYDLTQLTLTYSGAYQEGGASLAGWSMDHHLQARWEALIGRLSLRGTLQGDYARRVDRILGSTRNDGARLVVDVYWWRMVFQASAGISEGVSPAIAGPGSELLPSSFNTVSKFAAGSVGLTFDRGNLVLSLLGNATWVSAPGRPEQQQQSAAVQLSYKFGLTTASIEDRYSAGGVTGVWQQGNTVMARVTRNFGFGF